MFKRWNDSAPQPPPFHDGEEPQSVACEYQNTKEQEQLLRAAAIQLARMQEDLADILKQPLYTKSGCLYSNTYEGICIDKFSDSYYITSNIENFHNVYGGRQRFTSIQHQKESISEKDLASTPINN